MKRPLTSWDMVFSYYYGSGIPIVPSLQQTAWDCLTLAMLSNSMDKQAADNALPLLTSSYVFQFSDSNHCESKLRTHRGSYGAYVPDLSYAISVQGLDRFFQYREETYRWMLNV